MTTTTAKPTTYWVALCWGKVTAGPDGASGPPWLFLVEEHAHRYVAQLRGVGIDATVRGFDPAMTEWRGQSLIRLPRFPEPVLEAAPTNPRVLSSGHEDSASHDEHQSNGATSSTVDVVPPPPVLE